jgi:hypothetical protein
MLGATPVSAGTAVGIVVVMAPPTPEVGTEAPSIIFRKKLIFGLDLKMTLSVLFAFHTVCATL